MLMFEWILVLLLAAVILTNLAERLAVPYPSLLAIAGAGLAFLPFGTRAGAVRGAGASRRGI
jgi:monovalent cation/hydrogen antiporter